MIDTHTHLYDEAFDADGGGDAAVRRALAAGVGFMVLPNCDEASAGPLLALHSRHPEVTGVAVGLHPTSVDASWPSRLEAIKGMFADVRPLAVGEVGMDLYWDTTFRAEQREAFGAQLRLAAGMNLPVIVHCREALADTLDVIDRDGAGEPGILFHAFTSGPEEAAEILRRVPGAMFGIGGVATFRNAAPLREALPLIGLDRILLETDSPYLAPVPCRGRRNESAFLPHTAEAVARLLSVTPGALEAVTTLNARRFFSL